MADVVACLTNGKVVVIQEGREPEELESPYAEQIGLRERANVRKNAWKTQGSGAAFMGGGRAALWGNGAEQELPQARVVGVTRGRMIGELCYAISAGEVSGVFAQKPGTRDEQRLFHNADVQIRDLDFSFADEAFACTVEGKGGTSAIGVLADDGKGVRTVTEGDVLDSAPRWVPGGSGEIVYASAGIGRTQSGAWAGRAPFSLHRLRLNDGTVEVLVSDAKYDYVAPVAASDSLIYAIRRTYEEPKPKASFFGTLAHALLAPFAHYAKDAAHAEDRKIDGDELVRITPKSTELLARGVLAFDLAPNGDIVFSNGRALFRMAATKGSPHKLLANLERVEQIVIC